MLFPRADTTNLVQCHFKNQIQDWWGTLGYMWQSYHEMRAHYAVSFEVIDHGVPNILGLQTCVNNVWMLSTTMTLIFWNWTVTCLKDWVAQMTLTITSKQKKPTNQLFTLLYRRVPVTLWRKIQEELTWMEELDTIEKAAEPTDWVNSMVTIVKPNGSQRICIYPRDMNKAIKREPCTTEDIITKMQMQNYFQS